MNQDIDNPKEERKKMEKVISGTARKKKPSYFSKLTGMFDLQDVRDVHKYLVSDVFIPKMKDIFWDIVVDGFHMWLFGEERSHNSSDGYSSYVSYNDRYSNPYNRKNRPETFVNNYNLDNIYLDRKGEADEVIRKLNERILRYGIVTVAELYESVGWPTNYTDYNYGWTSLRNAESIRTRDGYKLKFPKPMPIGRDE